MDPISALSFASSIMAVIDFGTKVLSKSHEIYQSGSMKDHKEIEQIAQDFSDINGDLKSYIRHRRAAVHIQDPNDKALEELAAASLSISDELLRLLNRLKVDSNVRLWKSTLEAFLTVWKNDKIDAILERLDAIRAELTLRVVITNKNSLDGLGIIFQQSFHLMLTRHDDASRILRDLVQRSAYADQDAGQRHLELLAAIRASIGQSFTDLPTPWQDVEIFDFSQAMQKHILRSLMFYRMEDREEEIVVAHKKTFDWIFCDVEHQKMQWSNFSDWLRSGTGLYWVVGKAASGKSTLMKFVSNDIRTHQALKVWAKPHRLLISSFYFWNNGTPMQKSLEGLLRSILYDVLKARPELYSTIVTGHWRESVLRAAALSPPEPTLVQLQQAFRNLVNQRDTNFKLCLIIDGLDEYDCAGLEYPDLAELFKSISRSTNVKIIVSSRPLLVFEEAFVQESHLRLQELTADDIKVYVNDKLESHPRMASLRMGDPASTEHLKSAVISKASGVFLWVRLVVGSLLEGLTDGDGIQELQRTLDDLPEALEDLFRHMFRKIPQHYHAEASRIFQIVRQFQKTAETFNDAKYDGKVLTAITLSYAAEGNTALDPKTQILPVDLSQMNERCVSLERRLKSRCCGLIEIHRSDCSAYPPSMRSRRKIEDATVQFLHKTVTDFLDERAIWDTILTGPIGEFDPNMALLNSYIMQIKHLDMRWNDTTWEYKDPSLLSHLLDTVVTFAKQTTNETLQVEFLRELDRTMCLRRTSHETQGFGNQSNWSIDVNRTNIGHESFLSFCIDRGLRHYVVAEFKQHGKTLPDTELQLLLNCVRSSMDPVIVETLLEHGADPNKVSALRSPWSWALYVFRLSCEFENVNLAKILELYVLYHADPNAVVDEFAQNSKILVKRRYSALRMLRCSIDKAEGETLLIIQRLIKLLIERGAKEQEWCNGILVFPRNRGGHLLLSSWRSARPGKAHSTDSLPTSSQKNLLLRMIQHVKVKRTDNSQDLGVVLGV